MSQTNQAVTGKAAAAAAAKKMLEARIALVTTLGDAIDNHHRASDAIAAAKSAQDTAGEAARTALAAAISGGWTATELRNAGLTVPPGPRRKRGESAPTEPAGVETTPSDVPNRE